MEGWMNAPGSGILFCHLCCQTEWLTGCLSAQCAGMIGSWPAEKRPASFTYIHISAIVMLCVLHVHSVCLNMQIGSHNALKCVCVCVCVSVSAIVEHPDVSTASVDVRH